MGTAFNATTVALSAATTMMFCLFLCERTERGIITVIDRRVERELLNRFEVVDANLTPFLSAVQAANQTTLDAVAAHGERQLNAWSQALVALQQQAEAQQQWQSQVFAATLEKFEQRINANEQNRENTLAKAITALASHSQDHHEQINASVERVAGLQDAFAQVATSLSGVMQGEQEMVHLQAQLADNLRLLRETQQIDQVLARIDRRHPLADRPQPVDRRRGGRRRVPNGRLERDGSLTQGVDREDEFGAITLATKFFAQVPRRLSSLSACCSSSIRPTAETVARCGQGWLERIDGYPVLHLKGTPYEIGYQHGALLKQDVRANLEYLVNVKGATPVKIGPAAAVAAGCDRGDRQSAVASRSAQIFRRNGRHWPPPPNLTSKTCGWAISFPRCSIVAASR